ncbi:MerR family DNA-binding transcriptional regulator [Nonomuraea jiangxiensis]|nr:MerR family DNA-binding transcriptional regulator [Nonomuraea jiangxiensis]
MDGDALLTIGDLARRTGLTVKAIRFYSDRGLVPPTIRSPAGYRLLRRRRAGPAGVRTHAARAGDRPAHREAELVRDPEFRAVVRRLAEY